MYKRIFVAYDGSENARRALGRGVGVARKSGAELGIVVVADSSVLLGRGAGMLYVDVRKNLIEESRRLLSDAQTVAKRGRSAKVWGTVVVGNPPDAILGAASAQRADLIVVGRKGMSRIKRFLLGSVSSTIIDNAETDVLVVR